MALLTNINGKFSVSDAGAVRFNNAFTFPTADGAANYVLKTNGSGQLAWAPDNNDGSVTGSGAANRVTYWSSGTNVTSDAGFTYNGAGRVNTDESFGVSKDGADTVADGPFFRLTNAAQDRQYLNQLDASNNIDYWYYNGSVWAQTISLLNNGGATFTGLVTAESYKASNFVEIQVDDAEVYWTNAANNDYWVWKRDASNNFDLSHYNGTTTDNVLTFSSSNNATFAKNVGIGVVPGPVVAGNIRLDVGTLGCGITSRQNFETVITANADYGTAVTTGKPATRLYMTNGGQFQFETAPANTAGQPLTFTSRMNITSAGYVGIGSTLPDAKLEVVQPSGDGAAGTPTLMLSNDIAGATGYTWQSWRYNENNSNYRLDLKQRVTSGVVAYSFNMVNNGVGFDDVLVLDRGKVGIGTNTPNAPLHVIAASTSNDALMQRWAYSSGSSSYQLDLKQTVTSGVVRYNFSQINDSTAYNNVLVLDRGKVGIGTTSPSTPLMVNRASNSNEPGIYYDVTGGGSGSVGIGSTAAFGPFIVGNTLPNGNVRGAYSASRMLFNGAGFSFQTSDETSGARTFDDKMKIEIGGNVGIGTTGPSSKLTIFGGSSTTSTLELRGSAAGNDNATISTQQSMTFQIGSAGATGRGYAFNKGGLGYGNGTNLASISDAGTFTATGDVVAYSDKRLKSNIKTLDGSKVLKMRGVSFEKEGKKGSGVIAQELEKVAPELVNNDSEYKGVAYGNISGYLIEAIKELKAEIEELKSNKCNCNK